MNFPRTRCTAISKRSGTRCGRAAIFGGFVCEMHGGASPLARKAREERLLAMVDAALAVLQDALASNNMLLALRAAIVILDRAGFGAQATVTLQPAPPQADWAPYLTDAELAVLAEVIAAAKQRAYEATLTLTGEVVSDGTPYGIEPVATEKAEPMYRALVPFAHTDRS